MDDRRDLIEQLCTLAGMIFEDASADAVCTTAAADDIGPRIERIRSAAIDAATLANAALTVLNRSI